LRLYVVVAMGSKEKCGWFAEAQRARGMHVVHAYWFISFSLKTCRSRGYGVKVEMQWLAEAQRNAMSISTFIVPFEFADFNALPNSSPNN
jgi:hypothetical protein